jgi:predicted phosphodiesterase
VLVEVLIVLGLALLPAKPDDGEPVRIFFMTDAHSRQTHVERFVADANAARPAVVIDGGDMVHDGSESELRRALDARARLEVPWYLAPGNHDVELRGRFTAPPPAFPGFLAVEHAGIRFLLLDNNAGRITPEQFAQLEAELAAHAGARFVVAMHVPPFITRERGVVPLRHLLPFRLASPVMTDAGEVARFLALMERHDVLAVLVGHAHAFDDTLRGDVRYIVGGTLGGLLPAPGIAHEYVVLTIDGRALDIQRVQIGPPAREPLGLLLSAFRFLAEVNGFNRATQGWRFTPTTSVQVRTGVVRRRAGEDGVALLLLSFERQLGPVGRLGVSGEAGASGGPRHAAVHLVPGAKLRVLGGFDRNVFAGAALEASAGVLRGRGGLEARGYVAAGVEWHAFTLEVQRRRGGGLGLVLGRRY